MRGYWAHQDSNYGRGIMPWTRIAEDGTCSPPFNQDGYWGENHFCGHWWDQAPGTSQYLLLSNWSYSSAWTPWQQYAIAFVRCDDASWRVLGHSYSDAANSGTRPNGTDNYRSQPHATQSTDGRLVLFSSNMLDSPRIDAFLMEVPTVPV
jgi:hypothetical protein